MTLDGMWKNLVALRDEVATPAIRETAVESCTGNFYGGNGLNDLYRTWQEFKTSFDVAAVRLYIFLIILF